MDRLTIRAYAFEYTYHFLGAPPARVLSWTYFHADILRLAEFHPVCGVAYLKHQRKESKSNDTTASVLQVPPLHL